MNAKSFIFNLKQNFDLTNLFSPINACQTITKDRFKSHTTCPQLSKEVWEILKNCAHDLCITSYNFYTENQNTATMCSHCSDCVVELFFQSATNQQLIIEW